MTTLKDIAKECGLSVTTVSRVLNKRGYISEETHKKVHDAMQKLNYQPNELARSLSKQSTNTIGVIVPHLDHSYFSKVISHIEKVAYKQGYKILLFNSMGKDDREDEYLDTCRSNRVAGIILCSGTVSTKNLSKINVPIITMERYLENGTASVECDNYQGGKIAATHLYECGCKNVVFLAGLKSQSMPADQRGEGFASVCQEKGMKNIVIQNDPKLYETLEYHDYIAQIIKKYPETDGIFASSDVIAAQVIQVCHKMGIKIPEQIKLVGFDDVSIASLTTPSITTIHQPIKEMTQVAVDLIAAAGRGELVPSKTVLPVYLVKRETS